MSDEASNELSLANRKHLEKIRQKLTSQLYWPPQANALLNQLASSNPLSEVTRGDEDMLTLMVDAVLNGVDIEVQHPSFYRKLLEHADLREHFLDLLDAAEALKTAEAVPAKPVPPSFWQRLTQPLIEQLTEAHWRIQVRKTMSDLQEMFVAATTPEPGVVFRNPALSLDDIYIDLIRDEMQVANMMVNVFLQAKQPLLDPDNLELDLRVYGKDGTTLPMLEANLRWGSYDETAVLTPDISRVQFPPLSLDTVYNTDAEQVSAELHFVLSTAEG